MRLFNNLKQNQGGDAMKEIIIDGVDVAGCNFFIEDYQRANNIEGRYEHCKNVCELNGDNYFYCKMNKNCYYKQLKRLKKENEELKKYQYEQEYLQREIEKRQKALEEIREIINNHIKCFYGSCKDCLYYKECDMQNVECDCSKYHIDKINEVLK